MECTLISIRWASILYIVLISVLFSPTSFSADRKAASISKIQSTSREELRVRSFLSTADTCFVSQNDEIVMIVQGWVTGAELYKSLMDPAASCGLAYPFTVVEINMPMSFSGPTTLTISVDIESLDTTSYPGCPIPGEMLALSQDWNLTVPSAGVYNIWIPLDTPIVVNGPFYAGFFIGNIIDPAVNPGLLIDSKPVSCASFNIWDEAVGWVDLTSNGFFDFPGRLAMEVSGIPGGQPGGGSAPMAAILTPVSGNILFGSTEIWVHDSSNSKTADHAFFEYSISGSPFVEIGLDFDGYSPLRDGLSVTSSGSGFGLNWNFSGLSEGVYTIRATLIDSSGQSSSSTTTVALEPTPPTPTIFSPQNGSKFCQPLTLLMNSLDENLSFIQVEEHDALPIYSAGLIPVSQFTAGDSNGNPSDGNSISSGEFGNYYSGPVTAAMALKLWESRGVAAGALLLSVQELSEQLAVDFRTRENFGTYDEFLYSGLNNYINEHGNILELNMLRHPRYLNLRDWVEEQQRAVLLGLSGPTGIWVAIDGFGGWQGQDGNYDIKIANPMSGSIEQLPFRDNGTYSELFFNSQWHRVDIMISISPVSWQIDRKLLGIDLNGDDGWSVSWSPTGLQEDEFYYFRAQGTDATSYKDASTVLLQYQCSSIFIDGDYDDDGTANVGDLILLTNYITTGGSAPVGGGLRADANCDNFVNIADVVFYINFLFGSTSNPCY